MILDSMWLSFVIGGALLLAVLCFGGLVFAFKKPVGKGDEIYHRVIWSIVSALSLVLFIGVQSLEDQRATPGDAFDAIKIVEPQLTPNQVRRSSFHPDIFEVFNNGQIRYVIGDEYVIKGEVLSLSDGENLTQKQLSAYMSLSGEPTVRIEKQAKSISQEPIQPVAETESEGADRPTAGSIEAALAILANDIIPDEMTVVYPAQGEEKYRLTVFSDITCPVCERNHQDYEQFQQQGVTVRAALFPRAGMEAPEARVMSKVLCAESMGQRRDLLDRAYEGDVLEDAAMCSNEYLENIRNIAIAQDTGLAVEQTPTIMSSNGVRINGYPRENPVETVMGLLRDR